MGGEMGGEMGMGCCDGEWLSIGLGRNGAAVCEVRCGSFVLLKSRREMQCR